MQRGPAKRRDPRPSKLRWLVFGAEVRRAEHELACDVSRNGRSADRRGSDASHLNKAQVQGGRYESASEAIRDGLPALEEQETIRALKIDALRAEIERGAGSGPGTPAGEVFARARALIAQRAATNDASG